MDESKLLNWEIKCIREPEEEGPFYWSVHVQAWHSI